MDGVGDLGDGSAVGGDVQHSTRDRRLDVIRTGGGEVDAAPGIGREVVRANEGLAAAVGANGADLFPARIELREGIIVVARDQEVAVERDQSAGTATVLVPIDRGAATIPVPDVAGCVFDVEELAVPPQWSFGIVSVAVHGRDWVCHGGGSRRGQRKGHEAVSYDEP